MATVFRRKGSETWVAAYRVWDAVAGKWEWKQKSTGATDKAIASGIAATLERGSAEAKGGTLNRAKALEMVNDILRLAGLGAVAQSPPISDIANRILDESETTTAETTARKYRAQWTALKGWAGDKVNAGCDTWTHDDCAAYYRHCRSKYSTTTANDHLRFVSMLFSRAVQLGHCVTNPASTVKTAANDSVEKQTFTRDQCAKLYRVMRKNRRADWTALLGLGWHTGHRIQDLLRVVAADLAHDTELGWILTLNPAKKRGKGRTVALPLPSWLARRIRRLGDLRTINRADNRNGRISEEFVIWMRAAGIDPCPIKRGPRVVHLRSFHSLRHSMSSRLVAAGISGELARLVTDHDSPKVQRRYVHAEIRAIKEALAAVRARK